MYKAFNIEDLFIDDIILKKNAYLRKNRACIEAVEHDYVKPIESYLKQGVVFDGNAMKQGWFPSIKEFDVFISHSRNDKNLAYALAWELQEKFNLTSFIDSIVWKHFSSLKSALDVFFQEKYLEEYDATFQSRVNQHVLLMLNTSLMEVMDRSECLFFLNTSKCMEFDENEDFVTDSPWIFSEIGIFNNIRKKQKRKQMSEAQEATACFSGIRYKLDLQDFEDIDNNDFDKWMNINERNKRLGINKHPLDSLYAFCSRRVK